MRSTHRVATMKILVANIGSTSFKFKLLDMADESELARGGVERIGGQDARVYATVGDAEPVEETRAVADHGEAVESNLAMLLDRKRGCLASLRDVSAIGFKAVHCGGRWDAVRVDEEVLGAMEEFADVTPAHNPPYVAAMRALARRLPETPQVAAFETGFHRSIPLSRQLYAVPFEWYEKLGVRRYGFHGASHRYIAVRSAELLKRSDLRVISCHLGGSSSICAIRNGQSVANSFGMAPQSGLPHNNRVGDFDVYALLKLLDKTDHTVPELLEIMAKRGGLLGVSGLSNDYRDLEKAAAGANKRAKLAIDMLVESVRQYVGAYLVALNGADAIVFTGGMGENATELRARICRGLDFFGIELDGKRNQARGQEATISTDSSRVRLMTIPTNEELIVARQTVAVLASPRTPDAARRD